MTSPSLHKIPKILDLHSTHDLLLFITPSQPPGRDKKLTQLARPHQVQSIKIKFVQTLKTYP